LLCKETLGDSVEWLYDLTVGYPGIPPGENPEDVMTMRRIFCEGTGPHKIHIYIRRYRLDSLPTETEQFTQWLLDRWTEKDKRLIYFNEHGRFPEEEELGEGEDERILGHGRTVKVHLKLQHTIRECIGYLLYFVCYIPIVFLILHSTRYVYATILESL
jgi:hypothetical protein